MKKAVIYLATYCPFCHRALNLLEKKGFEIEKIDVTNDQKKWDEIAAKTGMKTVPQIFIDGEFIGGCDDLFELESKGKLNCFRIDKGKNISRDQILSLYQDAGWTSYTADMPSLMKAIEGSLYVATAWHGDELVGLLRAVGDGYVIVYLQDILVRQSFKRKGIGSMLVTEMLQDYSTVRQIVLLTDDTEETRGFYEAMGMQSCDHGEIVAFARFR